MVGTDGTTGTDGTSVTSGTGVKSHVPLVPVVSVVSVVPVVPAVSAPATLTFGSVIQNVEPLPSSESKVIAPPIASANWRHTARPSPVPPLRDTFDAVRM